MPFAEPAVHAMVWDAHREALWLGTPNEVGIFDGRNVRWPAAAAPEVLIPRSMAMVREGLLVGTINGTLWLFDGRNWKTLLDIGGQSTFLLAPDAHGGVFVANSYSWPDSRLRYFRNGRVQDVERGEQLKEVTAATVDSVGRLWMILYNAVHAFTTDRGRLVAQLNIPAPPAGLRPLALEIAPDHTVLVGHEGGLAAITPEGWKALPVEHLDLGAILAVKVDRGLRIWIAGERGLAFSDGAEFFRLGRPRVVASVGWPPALAMDGYGELWVGSSAGLWRVRLDVEHRALPGAFEDLRAAAGALWAAGEPGLVRVDPATGGLSWAFEGRRPAAIASGPGGETLWVLLPPDATDPGGLFRLGAKEPTRIAPIPPRLDDRMRLLVASDGKVWVAPGWGYELAVWDGKVWASTTIDAPRPEGGTAVAAMGFDLAGKLWVVLPDRIACLDGSRWVTSEVVAPKHPVKLNLHGAAIAHPAGGMAIYGPWRHLVRARLEGGRIVAEAMSAAGLSERIPEDFPALAPDGQAFWIAAGGRIFRWEAGRVWTVDPALEPWFPEIEAPLVSGGKLWGLSRFEDPDRTGPTTLASIPWATAPAPLVVAEHSALDAVSESPFFDVGYAGRSWWWKTASLVYRVTTRPEIIGQEEWTRDLRATFANQPHGLRRVVDVQAFDPLGRPSAPLRFARTVHLPVPERPWFLPATIAGAIALTMPLTAALVAFFRRFRAHGYRTLEVALETGHGELLAPLRDEVIALGVRPPLSSLREIGLAMGKLLPPELWRVESSRFRRDRRLRLVARDAESEWMLALPWEAAGGDETSHFLGQLPSVTILRCGTTTRDPAPRPPRLRLLHLVASPRGHEPLPGAEETVALRSVLPSVDVVSPNTDQRLTREALPALLAAHPADVLHLTCHGRRTADGFQLLLEDEEGAVAPLSGDRLAEVLRGVDRGGDGRAPFRLVALNVCEALGVQSPARTQPLGTRLLAAGADGVVGYLFELGSVSADIFWKTFYATWLRHGQVDHAAQRARVAVRALRSPTLHDFAAVGVFAADPGGRVCPP